MSILNFLKKKELQEIETLKSQIEKYKPIIDLDNEISLKEETIKNTKNKISDVQKDYNNIHIKYEELKKEISMFETKINLMEYGIYDSVYNFEKSDNYREEQKKIIEKQKKLISSETAAVCTIQWTVNGSEAKGKANTKKYIKLVLRAFNGECDSLILKVKWNNIEQSKDRIKKSFETINKISENQYVYITNDYLKLKLDELVLEHEFQLKKHQEKEELRRIQEELREEEKARKEIEQAQKDAEKEESTYQKALEKAREEISKTTGENHKKLLEQISKLEQDLLESQKRKERALSMAQQTKRGHVYIISNIGSFGDNVYKIGMTRRLEPMDRISELGDASVPFGYDVHALIFSEDAPSLEKEFHKFFEKKSVNMVNMRKEFFNVTIEEIEHFLDENDIKSELIKLPEASEYRETLSILESLKRN